MKTILPGNEILNKKIKIKKVLHIVKEKQVDNNKKILVPTLS